MAPASSLFAKNLMSVRIATGLLPRITAFASAQGIGMTKWKSWTRFTSQQTSKLESMFSVGVGIVKKARRYGLLAQMLQLCPASRCDVQRLFILGLGEFE